MAAAEPPFAETMPGPWAGGDGAAGSRAAVPATGTGASASTAGAAFVAPLEFTGAGGEYFRIWIVNTLLTLATLGIYSAWAKVRKASYFARNTRLLGDSFEFVADPLAILRGRILAIALLGFYTFAFDFSLVLGLVACAVLLLAAPVLVASAARFRLQNTRWRAIRFGFEASTGDAYRIVLVVVAVWISSTVAAAIGGESALFIGTGIAASLLLPWMHHRMKAFQHRHASFAGHRSQFRSGLGAFYGIYFLAFVLLVCVGFVAAGVVAVVVMLDKGRAPGTGLAIVSGGIVVLLAYLSVWPYFAAAVQRAVWERTTIGPHAFRTTIDFTTAWPVIAKNGVLLLLTAGLYWPFAVVAWSRYRIGCMRIESDEPLAAAVAGLDAGASRRAAGEGAVDFFGIDVGW